MENSDGSGEGGTHRFLYNQNMRMVRIASGQGKEKVEKLKIIKANLEAQTKIKYNLDYSNKE